MKNCRTGSKRRKAVRFKKTEENSSAWGERKKAYLRTREKNLKQFCRANKLSEWDVAKRKVVEVVEKNDKKLPARDEKYEK
jgi:hypothetical protein